MTREYTKEEKIAWLAAQPKKVLSSKVLLFDAAGKILVVKPSYKKNWDIPGGIVDQDESPLAAAIREANEELQVALLPAAMQFAGVRYGIATESQGDFVHFIFTHTVSDTEKRAIVFQGAEITEGQWLTPDAATAKLEGNHLQKFIAAILSGRTGSYADKDEIVLLHSGGSETKPGVLQDL